MSRKDQRSSTGSLLGSLAWPFLLGLAVTFGFYFLLNRWSLQYPLLQRYFAGHPINRVETALFFMGLVALVMKLWEISAQKSLAGAELLKDNALNQAPDRASQWLDALANLPSAVRNSLVGRRMTDALEIVERKGSAETLDDDLKFLSEADAGRAHDSYGLVRIIIWAIPMLGFLGTVVGITEALGDLDPQEMTNSLDTAIKGLTDGLYVAFDTTAIALCFAMVLMFVQFTLDRLESQLLATVDQRVTHELAGRFELVGAASDPHLVAIQRTSQAVIKATESLVHKQVELWQQSITAAHEQWQRMTQQSTEQMQTALAGALSHSLGEHAERLAKIEESSAEHLTQRWEQWQTALSQNARLLHAQQQELVKQGELMTQAIKAAGDVVQLERALNDNLSALAGSKNFEDTVMSLSAAIHLLNTRLGKVVDGPQVELRASQAKGRAA